MVYSVIGTGAIGGYYGGRLANAGKEVHFLLHRDYEHVVRNGLQVDSVNGSFHLDDVLAHKSPDSMPKSDVVLVCLKTVNNALLRELLPPLLKEDTLVLLIQNGIGVEADVQAMFPGVSLAAGLAFICCAKNEPGHVNHQCFGSINIGNYSCPDQSRVDALLADFVAAGIDAHLVSYDEARWRKSVWNMPFNGMTVVMQAQTDALLANPSTRALIKDQMLEVIHAARHLGVTGIDDGFADSMIEMTLAMVPYSPSMKLDYEFHRPMEIDYLYSRPIAIAHEAGFEMTKLSMLEAQLRFMEEKNL